MPTRRALAMLTVLAAFAAAANAHEVASGDQALVRAAQGAAPLLYVWLGAKHMVTGLDHLLYLVGVVFFLHRVRDVAWFVTLFAIGHSITLIAGTLLGVRIEPLLVDAAIGLSVTYKALENLELLPAGWRAVVRPPAAVFAFGLLHGLGLATRMQELRPPADGLLANLIAFNVGVELGQGLALLVIVGLLLLWRRRTRFVPQARLANRGLIVAGLALMAWQLIALARSGAIPQASAAQATAPASAPASAPVAAPAAGLAATLERTSEASPPDATEPAPEDLAAPQVEFASGDTRLARPGSHLRAAAAPRTTRIAITLAVEQGREVKAWIGRGEPLLYSWTADGEVYFDVHGDPDQPAAGAARRWPEHYAQRYLEGEAHAGHGSILPPFAGRHGIYFMNLEDRPVKLSVEFTAFAAQVGVPDEKGRLVAAEPPTP